jgi:VWFA-related protein
MLSIKTTILIVLLSLAAVAQTAGEETATFKSGVSNVRVDVQVTNGKDLITDLTQSDFIVYDNGQPQEIVYFGRESEPLALLLLLDVSGSMRKYLEQMASTAQQALRYLKVGDRVGIMLFSRDTKVRENFTGDLMEVAREIGDAVWDEDLGSGTSINTSILNSVDYMQKSHREKQTHDVGGMNDRHAILIVTDNLGLNYQASDEKIIRALYNADIVLNAIVVGKARRPEPDRSGRYTNPDFTIADVFKIAEQTGGEAVKAEEAGRAFAEMMERIRTRYGLHYKPPEARAGTFRRIRVDLTQEARSRYPNAFIRHRSGYYAQEE